MSVTLGHLVDAWIRNQQRVEHARENKIAAERDLTRAYEDLSLATSALSALVSREAPRRLIAMADGRACLVRWRADSWVGEIDVVSIEAADAPRPEDLEPCA